jgi:hypothetical protein
VLRISRNSAPKWAQNMYPVLTATNPCHDGKNFDELGCFRESGKQQLSGLHSDNINVISEHGFQVSLWI